MKPHNKKPLRVRVSFEFRNGDGNFLEIRHGDFVNVDGVSSIPALDKSYKSATTALAARQVLHDGMSHGC